MTSRTRSNIIDLSAHFIVASVSIFAIYITSHNLGYVIIFFMGSILIDLDHLIDHFLYFKNRFTLRDFFGSKYIMSGKVYIFFHAWELNLIVLFLSLSLRSKALFILFLALTAHLIVDCITNKRFIFYFLSYRIMKNFDTNKLNVTIE